MKLSVVIATLNRLPQLQKALDSIPPACGELWSQTQIIVVDGGSTDGTLDYLHSHIDWHRRDIEQGKPLGCVKAFNAGFRAAEGEYTAGFSDDSIYVGNTLELACKMLDERDDVGQVAIPYGHPGEEPKVSMMKIGGRLVTYANFDVTPRCLGEKVGWWGSYLFRYAGDNELSMQVWASGCKVEALKGGSIIHYESQDATRINSPNDTKLFYGKWRNWKWDDEPPTV